MLENLSQSNAYLQNKSAKLIIVIKQCVTIPFMMLCLVYSIIITQQQKTGFNTLLPCSTQFYLFTAKKIKRTKKVAIKCTYLGSRDLQNTILQNKHTNQEMLFLLRFVLQYCPDRDLGLIIHCIKNRLHVFLIIIMQT